MPFIGQKSQKGNSIIKEICHESTIDVSVYGSDKYNEFIYENPVMNDFIKNTMKNPKWIKRLLRKFYFMLDGFLERW